MMELSVVLLTWNSENELTPCLDALFISISHMKAEVIVVDNGSVDNTLGLLENYNLKLIKNTENRGVAAARNQALKVVNGSFVWILDIDTVVNPKALDVMLQHLKDNKHAGIVGCMLKGIDNGKIQSSCRPFPTLRNKFANAFLSTVLRNEPELYYANRIKGDVSFQVDYVIGACQLIKRELLEDVGLLDEHIFYGPEDADFCHRALANNWETLFLPQVSILHEYKRISHKKFFSRVTYMHFKGVLYYARKHQSWL